MHTVSGWARAPLAGGLSHDPNDIAHHLRLIVQGVHWRTRRSRRRALLTQEKTMSDNSIGARDSGTEDTPRLLDLNEAVAFLRGAYARRTLQNLGRSGRIRCIGRGERMCFVAAWLLEDLLVLRAESAKPSRRVEGAGGHESTADETSTNPTIAEPQHKLPTEPLATNTAQHHTPSRPGDGSSESQAAAPGSTSRPGEPQQPPSEAMTADEVAAFLGVDRKTVYDYANRGKIPFRQLGKRKLFSRSAIIEWLRGADSPERGD